MMKIKPTGVVSPFSEDEIIVSKTDLKGRITYANDVFVRVSRYSEEELLGTPHNLIRHPDMPKCVFKLLWDNIQARREVFAYVINLAKDGSHYWVLAHVTPTINSEGQITGYHSNRRSPSMTAVRQVIPLYQQLQAEENRVGGKAGIDAATALLGRVLASKESTYDQFIWSIISKEEESR